jgi:hypothetical protein
MIEPLRDAAKAPCLPDGQESVLFCRVRTSKGELVEGNLQIELFHSGSGLIWRRFHYSASTGEHFFRHLPHGNFTLRAEAGGFEPVTARVFIAGPRAQIEIRLQTTRDEPLVLSVEADRLRELDRLARQFVDQERAAEFVFQGHNHAFSLRTRIAAALLCDARVRISLENRQTLAENGKLAGWLERQIRHRWHFQVEAHKADRIVAGLVKSRLQFVEIVNAVFGCARVRRIVPEMGDWGAHLARFMATLDAPELDGVHPLLVQLFEPSRILIENFLRSIQNEFELRPPRGVAIPANRDGDETELWPALDDYGDEDRLLATGHIPSLRVLQLADALASAVEGCGGGDARPVS